MSSLNSLTLLEISTAMKRTSLSKSFRSFGLMAMLSAVVATTLQQPIQAQSKVQAKVAATCITLPEGSLFTELQEIKFSPKQKVEYQKILAEVDVKDKALSKRIRKVVKPDGPLEVFIPGRVDAKISAEINKASDDMARDGLPVAKRVEELTKRYGQYGATFSISPELAFTPEQIAERDKITSDYENQTLSILTPKQKKTYRANLVIKRGLEACDTNKTDG
jgi:hypothetical protein